MGKLVFNQNSLPSRLHGFAINRIFVLMIINTAHELRELIAFYSHKSPFVKC